VARRLEELVWESRFTRLPAPYWARVAPEPLPDPYLVAFNADAAALLALDPTAATEPGFVELLAGQSPWPGVEPVAHRYAGHQFGHYVPQLGDGRALLLGEVVGPDGARTEVQLKGSGRTPFSRGGDGRAVLRSTVREYLGSEAMHGLGIPTTRALAIVGSPQPVVRETLEPAALLVRLAPSHVRFGSFEMFAHLDKPELVRELADFVIATQPLGVAAGDYAGLLREVVARTARTVAAWQAVGFTHGVMNSDNMSILGLTLDYGPYAFVEAYEPDYVPNHSDTGGRYALGRQPAVAHWNLGCLAHAMGSLLTDDEAREALASYAQAYFTAYEDRFRAKLGLATWRGDPDRQLLRGLLAVLASQRVDYPRFFRLLGAFAEPAGRAALGALFADPRGFDAWAEFYAERLASEGSGGGDPAARRARMDRVNPKYVLRTHLAQRAIELAEDSDFSEIGRLLGLLLRPFDEHPEHEAYALPAPAGTPTPVLSCSA
jgi:uncharacterized protein YdiU (UPF0061 family)